MTLKLKALLIIILFRLGFELSRFLWLCSASLNTFAIELERCCMRIYNALDDEEWTVHDAMLGVILTGL